MMSVFAVPNEEDGSYFDTTIVVADVMVDGTVSDVRETLQADSRDLSFEKRRLLLPVTRDEIPKYYREEFEETILDPLDSVPKKEVIRAEVTFCKLSESAEMSLWYIRGIQLMYVVDGERKSKRNPDKMKPTREPRRPQHQFMRDERELMKDSTFKRQQEIWWRTLKTDVLFRYLNERLEHVSDPMPDPYRNLQDPVEAARCERIRYILSNRKDLGIGLTDE